MSDVREILGIVFTVVSEEEYRGKKRLALECQKCLRLIKDKSARRHAEKHDTESERARIAAAKRELGIPTKKPLAGQLGLEGIGAHVPKEGSHG